MNFATKRRKAGKFIFLKDILQLSLTAFGGPQAHLGMMLKLLVQKRGYVKESEFIEIISLCNMLPGPSSTQCIAAISMKFGGPIFALISLLVWMLPTSLIMTGVVVFFHYFDSRDFSLDLIKFIPAMAVGFIAAAAYRMCRLVIKNIITLLLTLTAANAAIFFNDPYVIPFIILAGGIVTNFTTPEFLREPLTGVKIRWRYLALFFGILIGAAIIGRITKERPVLLFENTYHFGSIVFGGGNVLVPLFYEQFVNYKHYLTSTEFITGYGIQQALPGPVFSFSTYVSGMSMQEYGLAGQLLGCLIGMIGIFLPGTFLIFFFYPIWEQIKKYPVFKKSIEGINAAAAGLVVSAAIVLFRPLVPDLETGALLNIGIMAATFGLVVFTKIPSPFIVAACLIAGILT